MIRAALFSTDTTHHAYYAWRLRAHVELVAIFLEEPAAAPFATLHPFERTRDDYEREVLLADCDVSITEMARCHRVTTVNDPAVRSELQRLAPDLVLVFGTGILEPALIQSLRVPLLNLHGGNPEEYRGLDAHLWAIYHGDFANLVSTLHVVDQELDTGPLVAQGALEFERGAGLHQLRAVNTQLCVELSVIAAFGLERFGRVPTRPQLRRGRYYSSMPGDLKQRCVERFERWTADL